MFGPFSDRSIAVNVGTAFGDASRRVGERRQQSMQVNEQEGTSERREESDTDDLIHDFRNAVPEGIAQVQEQLNSHGVQMGVEFHATNVASEERKYGADFGVRLHIEGQNYNISKGVLFQCKRMYGPTAAPTFRELGGRGEEQAQKMLSVTPASFFLLFNGIPARNLRQWIGTAAAFYPLDQLFPWPDLNRATRAIWDPGIMVLPASRVLAESRVCRQNKTRLPIDAVHWISGSIPLGIFMADVFGSCFVGDVRESVLHIVTPPRLRNLAIDGVPDFDPSLFTVKQLMDVTVQGNSGSGPAS